MTDNAVVSGGDIRFCGDNVPDVEFPPVSEPLAEGAELGKVPALAELKESIEDTEARFDPSTLAL